MREIYPINQNVPIYGKQTDVTREDINDLITQIDALKSNLTIISNNLADLQSDLAENVITQQIAAINGLIEKLTSASADIEIINTETITVEEVANIKRLITNAVQVAGTLDADAITTRDLNGAKIEATQATIGRLIATTAEVTNWIVDNFTANTVNADTVNADEITADDADITNINSSTMETDKLVSSEGDISRLTTLISNTEKLNTSKIVWKNTQTLIDYDVFYIEIPHFNNGSYYVTCSSDDAIIFTLEIFNSIDNYFVRWSQNAVGYIQNIYTVSSGDAAQLFIKCSNLDSKSKQFKYGYIAETDAGPIKTYETLPVTPQGNYEVVYQNGSKFFKNVDLANQGGSVGVLSNQTVDRYDLATPQFVYDTTGNVYNRTYKPDQSLNTNDDVIFNQVTAPFLGVTELTVTKKADLPHIYDGVELSDDALSSRKTDLIYISSDATSGTTNAAVRLQNKEFAASVENAYLGRSLENYGPYKTSDGYTVDSSSADIVETSDSFTLVIDQYNSYYACEISGTNATLYTYRLNASGSLTKTLIQSGATYRDSSASEVINVSTSVGNNFYISDGLSGTLVTVVISNTRLETVASLPYKLATGENARISRVTKNTENETVKEEFVPVANDLLDDNIPLGYDQENRNIKQLDDVHITGSLTVDGDSDFSEMTVKDRLLVRGDLQTNGEITAMDDVVIHGDLYVEGTEHVTETANVETDADYIMLRSTNPIGLGNDEFAGVAIHKYDGTNDLTLVTDNTGTLRLGTQGSNNRTSYTNISQFGTDFYTGLTNTEATVVKGLDADVDADEVDETVYYNGAYYHYDNLAWFAIALTDNALSIDYTSPIEDEDLIAALEAETKQDLIYYRTLTRITIDTGVTEPLATRDESDDMTDRALVLWNSDDEKLQTIDVPVQNNTVLTAKIVDAFNGNLLYDVDTNKWFDQDLQQVDAPQITGTKIGYLMQSQEGNTIVYYNDKFYYPFYGLSTYFELITSWSDLISRDDIVSCTVDSDVTKAISKYLDKNTGLPMKVWNEMRLEEEYPDAVLNPEWDAFEQVLLNTSSSDHLEAYKFEGSGTTIGYEWKTGGSGTVWVGTRAEYEVAKTIPEGADNHIPSHAIVMITDEDSYIEGEDR